MECGPEESECSTITVSVELNTIQSLSLSEPFEVAKGPEVLQEHQRSKAQIFEPLTGPHGGNAPPSRKSSQASSNHKREGSSSLILPQDSDFKNPDDFLLLQKELRKENMKASGQKVFMLSHCWRNPATQLSKRLLVSALALNGFSFWADFLDLQSRGPVAWRKEIEEGIRDSAKVVVYIDRAYLTSFNCLQEIAFALLYNKPIVAMLLEQDAMHLFTRPDGPSEAWHHYDLQAFEGKHLTPDHGNGTPLTLEEVTRLYEVISSINVCMCRSLDFENDTTKVVLRRAHDFVSAELEYQKEHALLQFKALEWEQTGEDRSRLLKRSAVPGQRAWIQQARAHRLIPAPTELQERFVKQSESHAARARRILRGLVTLVVFVVTGLAIMMAIQWQDAREQRKIALRQAEIAEFQTKEAQRAGAIAEENLRIAEEKALVASTQLFLFHAKTDTAYDGYPQAAMREALAGVDRLPASVKREVFEQRSALAQAAQISTVGYPLAALKSPEDVAGFIGSGSVSPSMRWVVHFTIFGLVNVYDLETMKLFATTEIPQHVFVPVYWDSYDSFVMIGYNIDFASPDFSVEKGVRMRVSVVAEKSQLEWEKTGEPLDLSNYHDPDSLVTQPQYSFSADRKRTLFGFLQSRKVGLFDLETGSHTTLMEAEDQLTHVDLSRSGRVAAAAVGRRAMIWHLDEGTESKLELAEDVSAVLFSPDASLLATRTINGGFDIWNVSAPSQRFSVPGLSGSTVSTVVSTTVAWSPDGRRLAAVLTGQVCAVLDVSDVTTLDHPDPEYNPAVTVATGSSPQRLEWGPDSDHLFLFDTDGSVTVAMLEDKADGVLLEGHEGAVSWARWRPDGLVLLSASRSDQTVRLFSLSGTNDILLAGRPFLCVDWSPDGSKVAAIDEAGTITVINADGSGERTLGTHPTEASAEFESDYKAESFEVAWSPGLNMLASLYDDGGQLHLWDLESGESRSVSVSSASLAICCGPSWSSQHHVAVACYTLEGGDGGTWNVAVYVVDARDRSVEQLPYGEWVSDQHPNDVAFSPTRQAIAVAGFGYVGLWELSSAGQWAFRSLGGEGEKPLDVEWSGDGERVLVLAQDRRVREYEVAPSSGCRVAAARAIASGLRGTTLRMTTGARAVDGGGVAELVAAVDGRALRIINSAAAYDELIHRQSRGVSREALLAHYDIREGESADAADCLA